MDDVRKRRIESAKIGDESSMALLMEEAWPVVFRFLRSLGAPDADAPDLVQEALIKGMTRLERYNSEKADLHTWLCAIAKNLFLDLLKRQRWLSSLDAVPEGSQPVSTLSGQATGLFADAGASALHLQDPPNMDLRDLLAKLPSEVRFAILMRYVHGYTNKAVARMLAIPEGTVKSKIHYGLGRLRKDLAEHA